MLDLKENEKAILSENIEDIINIFMVSHDEFRQYCLNMNQNILDSYFGHPYEKKILFSPEGAKDTYHNYYCFVFAKIMKDLFPEFSYYARCDEEHVALGCPTFIFDICGIYKEKDGILADADGDEYFEGDEEFLFSLEYYFAKLDEKLENILRDIFYRKVREYIKSKQDLVKKNLVWEQK